MTVQEVPCIAFANLEDEDEDAPAVTPEELAEIGPEKRAKSDASIRVVPIHPRLLALGFLRFVEFMRSKNEERLFPAFKWDESNGFGREVGRKFQRVIEALGIWVKHKKVFHSFRRTFNGKLMAAEVHQEYRELLLGHENGSTNVENYIKSLDAIPMKRLLGELSKVDYGLVHTPWQGEEGQEWLQDVLGNMGMPGADQPVS